jgi:hypothetical protein
MSSNTRPLISVIPELPCTLFRTLARFSRVIDIVAVQNMRQTQEFRREGNEVEFVIGLQRAFFKRPHTHSVEVDEVSRLRRFLHEAGLGAIPQRPAHAGRIVVVIDHHLARIYEDLGGSRPKREDAMKPYDPHGFHRHLIHRKETHYEGQRVPEETALYEQIAEDLKPANEIVLIGHGTGKSSALNFLLEYLKTHHSTIFPQVIAAEVADLSASTEPEIEAIAKQHL